MLTAGLAWCFAASAGWAADPYAGLSVSERVRRENDPVYQRLLQIQRELEPIPQIAKLKQVAAHPENLSDGDLQKVHDFAVRSRVKANKKWKHVEEMLRQQKFATVNITGRVVAQTLTAAGNVRERDARVEEIEERAEAAWEASGPPDSRLPWWKWRATSAYDPFRREIEEANAWLDRANAKVKAELKGGWSAIDTLIDNLQNEVLREYQVTVHAVRATEEEIERRRAGRERKKKEEILRGQLHLRTNASTEHLKTGETAEIWFWIDRGYPPYNVRVFEEQTKLLINQTYARAQPFMIPFRFLKAGRYLAQIEAYDKEASHRFVKVLFHVTGEEIVPVKTPDPGKPTTKPAKKPPATQPATQPAKPPKAIKPLVGRFNALLHPLSFVTPMAGPLTGKRTPAPIQMVIEINAAGRITGETTYDVPPTYAPPDLWKYWDSYTGKTTFRLEGTTDNRTGKTTLRFFDVLHRFGGVPKGSTGRREHRIKCEVTLNGWRIPGPKDQALLDAPTAPTKGRWGPYCPWPKVATSADGTQAFVHDGFFNAKGVKGDLIAKYKVHSVTTHWEDKSKDDGTANYQRSADQSVDNMNWYLQVLGPAKPPPPPAPPTPTGWGPLLGYGIWPKSPVTMTVGDKPRQFDARGVFRDKVWEAVKMNPITEWKHEPKGGLKEVSPGRYQALKPGTYYVQGRVQDKGKWFRDVIKVVVKPRPTSKK